MDIITNTILPGSAPGPGLPGERLGIPPRAKREAMAAEQRAASGGGGGMPIPPPPMGNPVGVGAYDQGRPPLPPPNMGGGGYGGDNGAGQGRMGYGGGPRRPLSPQRGELSFSDQPCLSFACSDTLLTHFVELTAPGAGGPPGGGASGGGGGGGYGYGRRY